MPKKKILIIDDFEPLLEEVTEFLAMEGYTSYSAKDGAEGIQMALQHVPDLIICDIEMPRLNGYDVFKAIEQIPSISNTPFIFLTARAQPEDFRTGLRLGADDYLTKPFELNELMLTIVKRLEKNEKIKQSGEEKFKALISNPLIGIFIYQEERFILTNDKLLEITGYSKHELNKIKLEDIFLGDKEKTINELSMCLQGIHDSIQIKVPAISKDKKALFLEIFGKSILFDNKKAIIGSVLDITNSDENFKLKQYSTESVEMDEIIKYLVSLQQEDIAKQIINIRQLMAFDSKGKSDQIKSKTKLTKRELQILELICKGYTNNEIAEELFISSRTVDNHRANLLAKTETKNTASLVAFAIQNKFVTV